MKAKKLLLALAVPAAFAACSQDEFVNEMQKVNDGRPVVGAIGLDIPEQAQTRWGWGSATGFTFDENDYMGAALMDTYAPTVANPDTRTWFQKYTIVDYISTNYKYGYKDGWTNNDAVMSEGNYFFYMPYNENLKGRAGLVYSIPTDQFAYDETAASPATEETRSWKKNQMFIGYDDVKVKDQAAKPQMVELFAKPRFNVNYIGSNGVKVERIVMRDAVNTFNVAGTLKPAGALTAAYCPITNADATVKNTYEVAAGKNLAAAFISYNAAVMNYSLKEGQDFVNPLVGNEAIFTAASTPSPDISLNFVPADKVSGLMVVPAGTHTIATDLEFDIYTNKGLVTLAAGSIDASGKLETAAANTEITYSNIDKLATIKAGDGVKANAVTINFGDKDVKVPTAVTVSTTAQLESIMRWYTSSTTDITLTVTIVGDEVQMTKSVYDVIKGNDKLTVKFVGVITIASDLAADAIMQIAPASTAIVYVTNEQTLNYTAANTALSYGIVVWGGTLNIETGSKTTTLANVWNYGTVNANKGKVNATTIVNYETLNVAADVTLTAGINNLAHLSTNSSTGYKTYTANAVINNAGLINVKGGENQGTINNNNKIDIKGAFTNNRVAKNTATNGTNGYTGKIYNQDASKSYIYSNAAFTNRGNIYNVGAIYSQGSGTITNANYIYAYDGATTYITTNSGEIELEKRGTETQVNGGSGKVSYTMQTSDLTNGAFAFDATSDKFNTLKVGMDVTFAHANAAPENIILQSKNLTVTCKSVAANELYTGSPAIGVAQFKSITAKAGYRYIVKGVGVKADKLTVESGAVFQIPALSTFGVFPRTAPSSTAEVNGYVKNSGEILVGGGFYANFNGIKPTGGKLSSAGTGSYEWNTSSFAAGTAVTELTSAGVTSAITYVVNSDVTISAPTAAGTLIGGGNVTVNTAWSSNALTVNSASVKIILGSARAPFVSAAGVSDSTVFSSLISTSSVANVKVGLYFKNTTDGKTYYREYKWDGTSTWTAQGTEATDVTPA